MNSKSDKDSPRSGEGGIGPWIKREGLALLVDLYELTMLAGYQAGGRTEQPACFEYFFRELPADNGFAVSAGLEQLLDFLEGLCFEAQDLDYLAGTGIFRAEFLEYLGDLKFAGDLWAVPEGTVVFPGEPLLRAQGPLGQVQLIESFVLNALNYPTLIATKAARLCLAAQHDPVMEFGLRRAQGPDGGLTGSRSAYIGGVNSTSNVLAGKVYGIPVAGTQAHSWVMSFDDELEAFRAYAKVFPEKPILLVDTYDTAKSGLPKALKVFQELRRQGREVRPAIRLDSGDLAALSKLAYRMFTEAGFEDPLIVASGDLNEYQIARLKKEGAKINCWGVGTQLICSYDFPALGGVYKLTAIEQDGRWVGRMKTSSSAQKQTLPGRKRLWRCFDEQGHCLADVIGLADEDMGQASQLTVAKAGQLDSRQELKGISHCEDLLTPVLNGGRRVAQQEPLTTLTERTGRAVESLPADLKSLRNPGKYPVYISAQLAKLTQETIKAQ